MTLSDYRGHFRYVERLVTPASRNAFTNEYVVTELKDYSR